MSTGYDPRERPRGGTPLAGLPSAPSHVVLARSRTAGPGKDRPLTRAQPAPVFRRGSVRVSVPYLEVGVRNVSHRISRQQPSDVAIR
jgi:hypothetical protein